MPSTLFGCHHFHLRAKLTLKTSSVTSKTWATILVIYGVSEPLSLMLQFCIYSRTIQKSNPVTLKPPSPCIDSMIRVDESLKKLRGEKKSEWVDGGVEKGVQEGFASFRFAKSGGP